MISSCNDWAVAHYTYQWCLQWFAGVCTFHPITPFYFIILLHFMAKGCFLLLKRYLSHYLVSSSMHKERTVQSAVHYRFQLYKDFIRSGIWIICCFYVSLLLLPSTSLIYLFFLWTNLKSYIYINVVPSNSYTLHFINCIHSWSYIILL
jgi:hypothetical protein